MFIWVKPVWKDAKLAGAMKEEHAERRLFINNLWSSAARDEPSWKMQKIGPSYRASAPFPSVPLLPSSIFLLWFPFSALLPLSPRLRPSEGCTDRPGSRDETGGLLRPEHVWGLNRPTVELEERVRQMKPFKGLKRVGCWIISWCNMEGLTEAL